jgi:hypothetical protein
MPLESCSHDVCLTLQVLDLLAWGQESPLMSKRLKICVLLPAERPSLDGCQPSLGMPFQSSLWILVFARVREELDCTLLSWSK